MSSNVTPYLPGPGEVTVISAEWCGECTSLKKMLRSVEIPYREVMIEEDHVAEQVAIEANGGSWLIPTVVYADGSIDVNPGLKGVQHSLARIAAL